MTKPDCNCFEIHYKNISKEFDCYTYIHQTMNQIEFYIHLCKLHLNKDSIVEMPYVSKTSAKIFRKMIHSMNVTRRNFYRNAFTEKNCYIDFPNKSIAIPEYLQTVLLYCNYLENIIEILLNPESKINVTSLKSLLESHLELLFIFEQYLRYKKYGYTYISETNFGNINYFQLFYSDVNQ